MKAQVKTTQTQKVRDKITLNEVSGALARSGYLLESRLETILRNANFLVETNRAYPDPDTRKSRELDLHAMGFSKAGPGEYDLILTVFLIECINNPQPIAFIMKEPMLGFLHHHDIKLAGLPAKTIDKENPRFWKSLPNYLGMDKYHHYCKGRIATQFCSFTRKRKDRDWMASHDEGHFECFRKLSAVVEHDISECYKSFSFTQHENMHVEFYYPVVVVQGKLLAVRTGKELVKISDANHIQFRRSAYVNAEEIDYQIDVVTERFFPKYLEIIYQEMSKAARLFRRRHKVIRKSINKITKSAKRLRSAEKIRAAMEFYEQEALS